MLRVPMLYYDVFTSHSHHKKHPWNLKTLTSFQIPQAVPSCNYSGTFLVPPAAAGEEQGKEARAPRAPARGLRPPALPAEMPASSQYSLFTRVVNYATIWG